MGSMVVLVLCFGFSSGPKYKLPPGEVAPESPAQQALSSDQSWRAYGYTIVPLCSFQMRGRVLSTTRYYFDRMASLSPVDFAMGWGPMSDSQVLNQLSISQVGRFYGWSTRRLPLPADTISLHSANMHMIPSNDAVRDQLLRVRLDDVISVDGYLIKAQNDSGRTFISSQTRDDKGAGACEIIWVEKISWE